MTWQIREEASVRKVLAKAPMAIQDKYILWLGIVREHGPHGLHSIGGFRDKALKGKLAGARESRLNDRYRVIYLVDGKYLFVEVVELTSDHTIRFRGK